MPQDLKKIRAEDPRRVIVATWDTSVMSLVRSWAAAFGTPNSHWTGYFCGNNLHPVAYLMNGTFHTAVDLDYCNYALLIGSQHGFGVGANPNLLTQKMANARRRGMRLVVVDPICSNAASKADEWIPIRPGTDGALALGIQNLLLNEYGIYDRDFLRWKTNASFLVDEKGFYLRDSGTQKVVVWDEGDERTKPFDDPTVQAPALEGEFLIREGIACTAFSRLKDHVKAYPVDRAAAITTIPADTIRRVAREFGEAARIGSVIEIEGKKFPYRPAAVHVYQGAYAHKHGFLSHLALQTVNFIIGSLYAVGGAQGSHLVSPWWSVRESVDGMISAATTSSHRLPYPPPSASIPTDYGLMGLFPMGSNISPAMGLSAMDPGVFHLPKPEMLIHCRTNLMVTRANPEATVKAIKQIPFMISFACEMNETAEFADIVLPDTHDLERLDLFPNRSFDVLPGLDHWFWGLRQPVVQPAGEARHWVSVLFDIAGRVGFVSELYEVLNRSLLKDPYRLDPSGQYSWEEILDRWARSTCGPDHGLDWFKQNGLVREKKKPEETYPRDTVPGRFPVYFEFLPRVGASVEQVAAEMTLAWDTSDYQLLPDWKPCPAFEESASDDSLYAVKFKIPFHTLTVTTGHPCLVDLGKRHPYAYKVLVPARVAEKKGIHDGDTIWIESTEGKVKGTAKVTECIHPEVIGIPGAFGHWAKGKPVGRGIGAHFNTLLPLNLERMDMVSTGLDACMRVRISKA
ncbi:MAG: molybdopterin-dependent oxidoreductase [Deltaproteobacteria bacterium]|nr:molybdopterin-dependent oxidoreductase [Deltaproteobacteria bacterium]